MDQFLKDMADILDEESVRPDDPLANFASWDSLAVLSVIAMADEKFRHVVSAKQIREAETLRDLYKLVRGDAESQT